MPVCLFVHADGVPGSLYPETRPSKIHSSQKSTPKVATQLQVLKFKRSYPFLVPIVLTNTISSFFKAVMPKAYNDFRRKLF